jgi:hypothetical protein
MANRLKSGQKMCLENDPLNTGRSGFWMAIVNPKTLAQKRFYFWSGFQTTVQR